MHILCTYASNPKHSQTPKTVYVFNKTQAQAHQITSDQTPVAPS